MFDPAAEYLLVAIAVLIPIGLLAAILYALTDPLSLDEVERRHREAHRPGTTRRDGTARSVADAPSRQRPGRPRRVA